MSRPNFFWSEMSCLKISASFEEIRELHSKQRAIASHLVVTEVDDDLIWNNLLIGGLKYNSNNIRIEYETELKEKR